MRHIKLLPALAAAAALLALSPGGALARKAGSKRELATGGCTISIEVASRVITYGEPATIFGRLSCASPASAATQPVTLSELSAHRAAGRAKRLVQVFTVAATSSTEASGAYQFTVSGLQANTTFSVHAGSARSASKTVKVAPLVTLTGPAEGSQLTAGRNLARATGGKNTVTFTGTVSPIENGAPLTLQRENAGGNEEWFRIGLGKVSANGSFAIAHTFSAPGDAEIRVVVHPLSHSIVGASEPLSYAISQPQNPRLTINPSSEPLVYGKSVTITGTLAGGASQPVALLAHTRGSRFVQIATAKTSATGAYSFSETPLESTFYKVASASTASRILFEGVKYALTATASASAAATGAPLAFSGTVTPAAAGHVIYLERQNLSGVGFHVVEVGTVKAGGSYSLTHAFFGAGIAHVRVKIPGDNHNQGVGSQLFTITLTPAPAAALTPVPASTLPPPGQL